MKTLGGEKVLEIRNLRFGYEGRENLYNDFSLDLERGECVSIVGPSGIGKTTLFELIAGNLTPRGGSISRLETGWIFQDPYSSFHPSYPFCTQIAEVAGSKEEDKELIYALNLDPSLLYRYPHELSGGQLQRCSILRALRMEPDLLLCDEPTSALDNITQLETMKLLISLLENVGILLITHDMELARWASDRIIDLGVGIHGNTTP